MLLLLEKYCLENQFTPQLWQVFHLLAVTLLREANTNLISLSACKHNYKLEFMTLSLNDRKLMLTSKPLISQCLHITFITTLHVLLDIFSILYFHTVLEISKCERRRKVILKRAACRKFSVCVLPLFQNVSSHQRYTLHSPPWFLQPESFICRVTLPVCQPGGANALTQHM